MTKACLLAVTKSQEMHIDALHATLHRLNETLAQGAIGVEMETQVKRWAMELDEASSILADDDGTAQELANAMDQAHRIVAGVIREMRNALFQSDCQAVMEATRRPSVTGLATHA